MASGRRPARSTAASSISISGQAASLAFPLLHLVYTIPPYLLALSQNLGRTLGGHPIVSWPNVHFRHRDGREDPAGLDVMETIIEKQGGLAADDGRAPGPGPLSRRQPHHELPERRPPWYDVHPLLVDEIRRFLPDGGQA